MDVAPSRIDISVGVGVGGRKVFTGMGVNVGGREVKVGGTGVGVGRMSTVNVQARVHKVIDISPIMDRRYLFCCIAFSLSTAGISDRE
jgi:hypothetical protein